MSVECIRSVWAYSKQKSGSLLVLVAIADHVNPRRGNIAWPSVASLAKAVRMTTRSVQRYLRKLEREGEIEIRTRPGRRSNQYLVKLPPVPSKEIHGDNDVSNPPTRVSLTPDTHVSQSVSDPIGEPTPVVPTGDDDLTFWTKICFNCFGESPRPVANRTLRVMRNFVQRLDRDLADSLVRFYHFSSWGDKEPGYSSRVHSPERLMRHLEAHLALAVRLHPAHTRTAPREHSIDEIREWLTRKYGDCPLPQTADDFYTAARFDAIRKEVIQGLTQGKTARSSASVGQDGSSPSSEHSANDCRKFILLPNPDESGGTRQS